MGWVGVVQSFPRTLRFFPVVMLIPFPILNSLNDCLEFGGHYSGLLPTTGLTLRVLMESDLFVAELDHLV